MARSELGTVCTICAIAVVATAMQGQAGARPLVSDKTLIVAKGVAGATTEEFVTNHGEPAKNKTTARVFWDDKALTVICDCADKVLVGNVTNRDGAIFYEDSVWVTIEPKHTHDAEGAEWFQFLSNPLGTIYDRKCFNKHGFNVESLVMTSVRTASGWRVKMVIPWAAFECKPAVGDVWALALNRVDYPKAGREFLCWSPNHGVKTKNFLSVDRWGHIVFADEKGNAGQGLKNLAQQHEAVLAAVKRKADYVDAVSRGIGFVPGQSKETVAEEEKAFRAAIEKRKDEMLAAGAALRQPVLFDKKAVKRARRNIEQDADFKKWFEAQKEIADFIVGQPDEYVEEMISTLTPGNSYCRVCPHCNGKLSRGSTYFTWDRNEPDTLRCRTCDHAYPDPEYGETAKLVCPRTGQTFTYYLNKEEKAHPEDRSGKYAYSFCDRPVHVTFSGLLRYYRAKFMWYGAYRLAVVYSITDDPRYARRAVQILARLAHCYRNWLYHDYWDTTADCDPLYAAFHYKALNLEWKRNLSKNAFTDDTTESAAMLRDFWGAGRMHASIGVCDSQLIALCNAYSLIYDATDEGGRPLWSESERALVERDLFLEAVLTSETFLGGRGKASDCSNLGINVYETMANVARCLGIAEWADVAARGYERILRLRIGGDGVSKEAPTYNNRYLRGIFGIVESVQGFPWPKAMTERRDRADLYKSDPALRVMLRSTLDSLSPNGRLLPFSDTFVGEGVARNIPGIGLRRFPRSFSGSYPTLANKRWPELADLFLCEPADLSRDTGLNLREGCFPGWMTAILRNGNGSEAATLAFAFNWGGIHRQRDSLGIYYIDGGNVILGDPGYRGNHTWMVSSFSHNLVTVDDKEQFSVRQRVPAFQMMATSPKISVVEASAKVYSQCSEYRRLVALVKGHKGRTFALDIFRVKGGNKHDYRIFSELGSSDDGAGGSLEVVGVDLPAEKPLPQFGGSTKLEDSFGLRDIRTGVNVPNTWQAIWRGTNRSYRLWMLTKTDAVHASNGPGYELPDHPGRRVRYVDAIRNGEGLASVFVAIHEPGGPGGEMTITGASQLDVPASAGPDAMACQIESEWGTYRVFSEFAAETEVAGVRFKGKFGVLCKGSGQSPWFFAVGASTLKEGTVGFADEPALWCGNATTNSMTVISVDRRRPAGWRRPPRGCTGYVLVRRGSSEAGYPVKKARKNSIVVDRFPLKKVEAFELPALRAMGM